MTNYLVGSLDENGYYSNDYCREPFLPENQILIRKYGMKKLLIVIATFFMLLSLSTTYGVTTMDNNQITIKQQSIIPIAAFTADGDLPKLKLSLTAGLDNGLTVNEIKEVLVQMYAYVGFPRSLNAITTFKQLLDERQQKGINDPLGKEADPLPTDKTSLALGTDIQTYLVGMPVSGGVMEFTPAIDQFLKAHLFGDIFGRNNLDYQSREIATIAALAISDSLRQEEALAKSNIRVTVISPGAIATELTHTITDQDIKGRIDKFYQEFAIQPERIAEVIAFAINSPADTAMNEIIIRPTCQQG